MNPRDLVYSPEQNCALWVSAWIHGTVSLDDAQDALWELDLAMDDEVLREVLAEARAARDADTGDGSGIVRLLLGGYGRPLPRGVADGFGIVSGPLMHAWSPYTDEDGFICWAHSVHDTVLFNEPHMPGEADFLLAEATRQASALIDALQPTYSRSSSLAQPRLVVGTLTDFYEAPAPRPGSHPGRRSSSRGRTASPRSSRPSRTGRATTPSMPSCSPSSAGFPRPGWQPLLPPTASISAAE